MAALTGASTTAPTARASEVLAPSGARYPTTAVGLHLDTEAFAFAVVVPEGTPHAEVRRAFAAVQALGYEPVGADEHEAMPEFDGSIWHHLVPSLAVPLLPVQVP